VLRLKHAAQSQKQVINCQVFILVEIVTDSCDGGFVVYSSNHDGNRLFDDSLAWIRRKFWHLVAVEWEKEVRLGSSCIYGDPIL